MIQVHGVVFRFILLLLFDRQQQQQLLHAFSFTRSFSHGRSSLHAATRDDLVQDRQRRQTILRTTIAIHGGVVFPSTTVAAVTERLATRVYDNRQTPPSYGLQNADIYYPSWLEGKWNVQSSCTSVEAPCGIALFGGNRTYETAQHELHDPPLQYEARFVRSSSNDIIADREFNVRSIAQAVMGPQSVLDIPLVTPNKLTCILLPTGASAPFQVNLFTLQRQQETPASPNQFDCSEVSQEIITTTTSSASNPATTVLMKEVETISLYSYNPTTQQITCQQRSAKFLLPSQQDPTALRLWQMTGGRPVDVRYYTVTYQRVS